MKKPTLYGGKHAWRLFSSRTGEQESSKAHGEDSEQQNTEKEDNYEEDYDEGYDEDYEDEERQKKGLSPFRILYYAFLGTFSYNYYLNLYQDVPEESVGYIKRISHMADWFHSIVLTSKHYLVEPPSVKMLFDTQVPKEFGRKKTLVIKLEDLLINKNIQFGKGPEIKLRNKVRMFLTEMKKYYEVVIFSNSSTDEAEFVMQALGPDFAENVFGNEFSTMRWAKPGQLLRNLDHLNRDIKNVVVLDFSKDDYPEHQNNIIVMKKFKGSGDDYELVKVSTMLKYLANPKIKNFQDVLKTLGEDPLETFTIKMREKIQRQRKKFGNTGKRGFFSNSFKSFTRSNI